MKYKDTVQGIFLSRPNRFIAHVDIGGEVQVCHVKNTGRCRELLVKGARVILQPSQNPERKTKYDLIAVYKGGMLINMDSQAPNKVIGEWIETSGYFDRLKLVKPEAVFENSRFDFYIETEKEKIYAEVKGVTLEENGVVRFPDAPTERGVKHLRELCEAVKQGYDAYVFFVIQMAQCRYFTPNRDTHPEFAHALREASESGVKVVALTCNVTESSLDIDGFAEVIL